MKKGVVTIFILLCSLLPEAWVQAHSIHVFAEVKNGIVEGEGYLSGGRKVVNGEIQVQNAETGDLVFTTHTDAQGKFSFPIAELDTDQAVDLLIVLNGGPGHRSQWEIPADQYVTHTPQAEGGEKQEPPAAHPPLQNIIAGIGCILAIGAVTAFVKSRKRGSS